MVLIVKFHKSGCFESFREVSRKFEVSLDFQTYQDGIGQHQIPTKFSFQGLL